MKKWHHDQIHQAAIGCISGSLIEWPYLAEALMAQGVPLPPGTTASTVQAVCKLILTQRKVGSVYTQHLGAADAIQERLLDRECYLSRRDICELYNAFCEAFAATSWVEDLGYWDQADHIGPIEYILARVAK